MTKEQDIIVSLRAGVVIDLGLGRSSTSNGGKYNLTELGLSKAEIEKIIKQTGVSVTQAKGV